MGEGTRYPCIIVDDSEIDRLMTLVFTKKYPFLDVAGVFASAEDALSFLETTPVAVLLSDIDMPGLSGLEFRSRLMQIPACIFITAYPDYAAESFEVNAFDFLVKPLRAERFAQCMARLQSYLEMREKADRFEHSLGGDTIFIKDGHTQIKVRLHDIVYLEALKDYTRIITSTQKYSVLASIGTLLKEGAFQSFLRVHRSYAVQRHYIERVMPGQVMVHSHTLPVGRSYREVLSNLA